jgi:Raf kinase inhibitor-like YbhB/YbcL family protein
LRSVGITLPAATLTVLMVACDTNDGRELREPTEPAPTTSAPPADSVATIPAESAAAAPASLQLTAPWGDGAAIDARYTCDGDDVSPALSWTGLPDGTVEVAIVVVDDDADGFVHWVVTSIDPATTSLLEGSLPPTAIQPRNSFGNAGWGGPCPPPGSPHSYRFTVHALNQPLQLADDTPTEEAIELIDDATIGSATIFGTYGR